MWQWMTQIQIACRKKMGRIGSLYISTEKDIAKPCLLALHSIMVSSIWFFSFSDMQIRSQLPAAGISLDFIFNSIGNNVAILVT